MKIIKTLFLIVLIGGVLFATAYFIKTNSKSSLVYETEQLFEVDIKRETIVTGKLIPQDEIEIKPQISGIIETIYVKEGDQVQTGDLLSRIKVVPNEQSLNAAAGRVRNATIALASFKREYERSKKLFEKGIVAEQAFQSTELQYQQAQQELLNAESDLQIIKEGSLRGANLANTNILARVNGTVLEIPIEEGDQVIQSNNFNAGTTIATIADLNKMIFEGKVDEAEVAKLKIGTPLKISLGAVDDQELKAVLRFIAPKGTEDQGTVQFKVEADVELKDDFFVRAGYSANASIVLEEKKSAISLREALIQYDRKTQDPYVEIMIDDQEFERRDVELGLSDGINVEILKGINAEDKVKVWNKTEDREDDEA